VRRGVVQRLDAEQEEGDAQDPGRSGFAALGLCDSLVAAVEAAGYTIPTPIQAKTIPLLLSGRDVVGQAQTGTGKTAAFALPMLQKIDMRRNVPQVLVLTPTRELAIQVAEAFEKYARRMGALRVAPIYGGQDYQVQFRQLDRGVHVVVGTPGRVMDHMRRGSLNSASFQCLVLDEADEMLRMGFAEDVDWILTQMPAKRQIALFSATMPAPIRQIAQQHLHTPAEITIRQKTATADTINQRYLVVAPHQKEAALARVLESEPTDGVLVFVKTKSMTEPLAEYLGRVGLKAAALSGDLAQKQRERIVDSLKSGKIDVIVATDVAARGLDVQRISHVVNYDLPRDSEAYVHRIGRTGRAGRSGEAIVFVHPREQRMLQRLEYATRHKIEPMELPTNRMINKQRVARFHERITEALGSKQLETFQSIVDQYLRENEVSLEMIAAALAVLANADAPLLAKGDMKQASFEEFSHRPGSFKPRKRPFDKFQGRGKRKPWKKS
jgi:ATP-dependent RNA helicase DeaD